MGAWKGPETLVQSAHLFNVPVSAFFPRNLPSRQLKPRASRIRVRRMAEFMAAVRSIPSHALQETMAQVTALVLAGQRRI
jgi:hypothetical protein